MKKGICIGSLPEGSYLERFKLAKEAGFAGVEPMTIETDKELEEVKEALDAVGYDDYLTAELPVDKDDPGGTVFQISEDIDKILEI